MILNLDIIIYLRGDYMPTHNKKEKLMLRPTDGKKSEIIDRPLYDVWDDVDQLFDQFRSNFNEILLDPRSRMITPTMDLRAPLLDVVDLGDRYEMKVEMPGMTKKDVSIEVTPNEVEISSEKKTEEEQKGKN